MLAFLIGIYLGGLLILWFVALLAFSGNQPWWAHALTVVWPGVPLVVVAFIVYAVFDNFREAK